MPDDGPVGETGLARRPGAGDPARYQIRVQDHLDSCWSGWFDGLTVRSVGLDETLIEGMLSDQAALHGALARIRDLNLVLLSVERVRGDRQRTQAQGTDSKEDR